MENKKDLQQRMTRRECLKHLGLGCAGAVLASYPIMIEPAMLQINTYKIPLSNLPPAFHGFRILQLTDTHLGALTPAWFLQSVIQTTKRIPCDLIVFTGDAVDGDGSAENLQTIWKLLGELQAPAGVFAVFGNHDHWIGLDQSLYWADKMGLSLRHQGKRLTRQNQHLWLAGLGDYWEDQAGEELGFANADAKACKIALAHNPDTADLPLSVPIDLFISGHTHGGQVNLPFLREMAAPINNKAYIHGLVETAHSQVFVSRGIGCSAYPLRFSCVPEIAVLNLTCA